MVLRYLEILEAVAECGTFTGAAKKLYITQSAPKVKALINRLAARSQIYMLIRCFIAVKGIPSFVGICIFAYYIPCRAICKML